MAPTQTLPLPLAAILAARQMATVTVAPAADTSNFNSGGSNLSTGAIVGIVIGSVVGILLILWVIKTARTPAQAPDTDRQGWFDDDTKRPHSSSRRHNHHHDSQHERHHRSRSHNDGHHHHHRHRSSTPRPVVLEEKDVQIPARPSATYVYKSDGARRSRSQRRSRSRSGQGYYVSS